VPTASIDPTCAINENEREIRRVAAACAEVIGLHGYDKDAFVSDALSRTWLAFHRYDGQISVRSYINMVIRSAVCDKLRSIERERATIPYRDTTGMAIGASEEGMEFVKDWYEVDYAAAADCRELMSRLTPGQRTRLREIADGSEIEAGACASRQRYIRIENSKLLSTARDIYHDYRPARTSDQECEPDV